MAKQKQLQVVSIVLKRHVDGKTIGARSWTMSGIETDLDKFEDALSYLCGAAMDHIPKPPPELAVVGKSSSQTESQK